MISTKPLTDHGIEILHINPEPPSLVYIPHPSWRWRLHPPSILLVLVPWLCLFGAGQTFTAGVIRAGVSDYSLHEFKEEIQSYDSDRPTRR